MNNYLCPLCNGFESVHVHCEHCGTNLEDKGRLIDYFDDYSAYLEIEDMKKIDGINNDYQRKKCPHLLMCSNCHEQSVFLVSEW